MGSILFKTTTSGISSEDLVDALRSVGVGEGDVIFVHSDISAFGMPISFEKDVLMNRLYDVFYKAVGVEGLLIIPTFTYSFCKNEVFDVQKTRSTVGAFTEWFRTQEGVVRSKHPIFSVAYKGAKKYYDELEGLSTDSFDEDSIFGKVRKLRGKIVFFGVDIDAATFIHYVEQAHGVPYRYIKSFSGIIGDHDRQYAATCSYNVRDMAINPILDLTRLGDYLASRNLLKRVKVAHGQISAVDADVLFVEGARMLDKDINYFLKGKTAL